MLFLLIDIICNHLLVLLCNIRKPHNKEVILPNNLDAKHISEVLLKLLFLNNALYLKINTLSLNYQIRTSPQIEILSEQSCNKQCEPCFGTYKKKPV